MSDITWTPVTVKLGDIAPWERNPKKISKKAAERLLALWDELGQFQTLAIGPNGELYDGHQRLSVLLAAKGGDFEVAAMQSSRPLEEKERERLVITAHVGTVGEFDWGQLKEWDAADLSEWGMEDAIKAWGENVKGGGAVMQSSNETQQPPKDFKEYDENLDMDYCCPRCGYRWSGEKG